MIEIDGSQGEGGGQVLRTSLALSLATQTPFRLYDIRAGRKKPGMRAQHLASVHAAMRVGAAEADGARPGSDDLTFTPQGVIPGDVHVDVGTAGSATLVVQTILPPLLTADGPSSITVTGGTHNAWAPPFEFLERAYLPLVARMGPHVTARCSRPGFAPVGGGRLEVNVEPAESLGGLELLERGRVVSREAVAMVSQIPGHVATRELGIVQKKLGWPQKELVVREVPNARGPGNALVLTIGCEHVTEVFFEPGARGTRAEVVARRAVGAATDWMHADVPVAEHLADQLLLPLALGAGGRFRTTPLSEHAVTQIALIQAFLDVEIEIEEVQVGAVEVRVTT